MTCGDFQERIVPIAEGDTPSPVEEAHVVSCEPCRVALARSREICRELSLLPAVEVPAGAYQEHLRRRQKAARRRLWLPLSLAATVLFAIAVGAFFMPTYKRMDVTIHDVEGGSGLLADDAWLPPSLAPEKR